MDCIRKHSHQTVKEWMKYQEYIENKLEREFGDIISAVSYQFNSRITVTLCYGTSKEKQQQVLELLKDEAVHVRVAYRDKCIYL